MGKIQELFMTGSFLIATLVLIAISYLITIAYMLAPVLLVGAIAYWLIMC
jgi:hypothetical protein